ELDDRTGMADGLVALEGPVMLERRPLGMAVRIARRDVEGVEDPTLLDKHPGNGDRGRELAEEPSDDVAPRLLSEMEVQGPHGHLGRLLGGEAGPLVASVPPGGAGLLEVPKRLQQPVARSIRHGVVWGEPAHGGPLWGAFSTISRQV